MLLFFSLLKYCLSFLISLKIIGFCKAVKHILDKKKLFKKLRIPVRRNQTALLNSCSQYALNSLF
jgi:hypothetical protein